MRLWMKTLTAMAVGLAMAGAVKAQDRTPTTAPDNGTVVVLGEKPVGHHQWFRAESDHFVVYSDTSHAAVGRLLERLERLAALLRAYSGLDPQTSYGGSKMAIYYFNDRNDLETVAPDRARFSIGLYSSCEDGVEAFAMHRDFTPKPDVATALQSEDAGMVAIQQAYARHFFYSHFPALMPLWYIEGYAQYFSTIRFDQDKAVVGLPPSAQGVLLWGIDNDSYKADLDYLDLLINDARHHVGNDPQFQSRVTAAGDEAGAVKPSFQKDDHFADSEAADRAQLEFEGRAWLLTHWILSVPERAKKLPDYVAAVRHGDSPAIAFHKIFGQTTAQLEATLSRYLRKTLVVGTLDAPAVASAPAFDDLPDSAAKLLLLGARIGTCPSVSAGKGVLDNIRAETAKFPGDVFAGDILSQAEIAYGEPQTALPWLNDAVTANPGDFGAQYLLGRGHLAAGDLADADAAFTAAARINPNSATNSFWYYRTKLAESGLSQDAAGAAVHAWHMAPEVGVYAFHAALVYALSGDAATAQAMLDDLAVDPRGGDYVRAAADWRGRLASGVPDADILAALKGDTRRAGQSEWTLDGNEVLGSTESMRGRDDFMTMYRHSQDAVQAMTGRKTGSRTPVQGQRPASEE